MQKKQFFQDYVNLLVICWLSIMIKICLVAIKFIAAHKTIRGGGGISPRTTLHLMIRGGW